MKTFLLATILISFTSPAFAGGADLDIGKYFPKYTKYDIATSLGTLGELITRIQPWLRRDGVLLNFVYDRNEDRNPRYVDTSQGGTLRGLLDRVVAMHPDYAWREDGRIVTLYSKNLVKDPDFILNLRLGASCWKGKNRRELVEAIQAHADQEYPGKYRRDSENGKNLPVLDCVDLFTDQLDKRLFNTKSGNEGPDGIELLEQFSRECDLYWSVLVGDGRVTVNYYKGWGIMMYFHEKTWPIQNFAMPFRAEAFLRSNSNFMPVTTSFFLADPQGGPRSEPYLALPRVDNAWSSTAFHSGHLYAMLVEGNVHDWTRKIVRYDENKQRTVLFEGKIDSSFLVSNDERYVAFRELDGGHRARHLYLLDISTRKIVKSFSTRELGLTPSGGDLPLNLVGFYQGALWVCDGEADEEEYITHFVRIEEGSWRTTSFKCTAKLNDDGGFNPYHQWIVYDDFVYGTDLDRQEKRGSAQAPVHLFLYNMLTDRERVIATAPGWRPDEKWIGPDTLEYRDPNGKGLKRTEINSFMGN